MDMPSLSAEAWDEQMEDLGYTTKKRWKRRDEPITTEEQAVQTEWNKHKGEGKYPNTETSRNFPNHSPKEGLKDTCINKNNEASNLVHTTNKKEKEPESVGAKQLQTETDTSRAKNEGISQHYRILYD